MEIQREGKSTVSAGQVILGPAAEPSAPKKLRRPLTVGAFFGSFFSTKERTWNGFSTGSRFRFGVVVKMSDFLVPRWRPVLS